MRFAAGARCCQYGCCLHKSEPECQLTLPRISTEGSSSFRKSMALSYMGECHPKECVAAPATCSPPSAHKRTLVELDQQVGVHTAARVSRTNAGRQSQSSAPKPVFLDFLVLKRNATAIAPRIGNSIPQAVTLAGLT